MGATTYDTSGGQGGKSMGGGQPGGPYTARPDLGPGVGFGVGLPQPGGQNPMDILGGGLNAAFGGTGVMPLVNTAGQAANNAFGGLSNSIQGNQPAPNTLPTDGMSGGKGMGQDLGSILGSVGNLGSQMLTQINPGLAPIGNVVNTAGQGAGAILGSALNNIQQQQPGGPYTARPDLGPGVGFGVGLPQPDPYIGRPDQMTPPQPGGGIYGRDMSGNPNMTPMQGGMGTMATTPVNRYAPPNAPGVRRAPAVSNTNRANPRTTTPQPITRTRAKR